jgi:hypothetical protein
MRKLLFAAAAILALSASARALTPAQLTPDEQTVYDGLKNDPDAAKNYLATRGFLKLCEQVAARKLAAIKLPRQPANYDTQYVTDEEQAVVDQAVLKYVSARINSPRQA